MTTTIRDQLRATLQTQVAPAFAPEVPIAQQRLVLDGMGAAAALPEGLAVVQEPLAGMHAERLTPADAGERGVLLYLHGGGYAMGSCTSHRALVGRIAAACGLSARVPEYRLAPEHRFPAAIDDALAAYRALLAAGHRADEVIVAGDSAGGGLCAGLLVALRDAGDPLPAAAILLSPFTDLTFTGESVQSRAEVDPWLSPAMLEPMIRLLADEGDRRDPRASPVFADLRGLPPLLIHVGDQEILLSDSTRLAERAQAAGVAVEIEVWPELWHVFHFFAPLLPEANEALAKIGAFARARLAGGAAS
ncbi:MAG: alpha/beta hydrolase [Nannocystaceae bacterium]